MLYFFFIYKKNFLCVSVWVREKLTFIVCCQDQRQIVKKESKTPFFLLCRSRPQARGWAGVCVHVGVECTYNRYNCTPLYLACVVGHSVRSYGGLKYKCRTIIIVRREYMAQMLYRAVPTTLRCTHSYAHTGPYPPTYMAHASHIFGALIPRGYIGI